MNALARPRFRPQLEVLEDRSVPSATQKIPVSAFIAVQGSTSEFGPATMPATADRLPDNIGFTDNPGGQGPARFGLIDINTKQAAFMLSHYGIDLHTTYSGNVTARPLAGGLTEVSVELFTHNALAWVSTFAPDANGSLESAPLLFGARARDLIDGAGHPTGVRPALADSHVQLVYRTQHAGDPILQDLVVGFGNVPTNPGPRFDLVSISQQARATGTVHSVSGDYQGKLNVTEIGPVFRGGTHFVGARSDGFPVETINIM